MIARVCLITLVIATCGGCAHHFMPHLPTDDDLSTLGSSSHAPTVAVGNAATRIGIGLLVLAVLLGILKQWLPLIRTRLIGYVLVAGLACIVVGWIVARLVAILALLGLAESAYIAWRWFKARHPNGHGTAAASPAPLAEVADFIRGRGTQSPGTRAAAARP